MSTGPRIDGSGGKRVGMCADRQDLGPLLAMIRELWFQGLSAFKKNLPPIWSQIGGTAIPIPMQWVHVTPIHSDFQ